jgi:hypothetical protein
MVVTPDDVEVANIPNEEKLLKLHPSYYHA